MKKVLTLCLAMVFSFALVSITEAKDCDIKVPQDFGTIQEAIDFAGNGGTVCVGNGVFQSDTIWIKDKDVNLIGSESGKTVIEYVNVGNSVPDVWYPENHSAISLENVSENSRIENLEIRNAHFYGIHLLHASPLILGNVIWNNGLGIKVVGNSEPGISYNVIANNDGYGIASTPFVGGYEISHNTIVANGLVNGGADVLFNPQYFGVYHYPDNAVVLRDNIISGSPRGVWEATGQSNYELVNNLFWNTTNVTTTSGLYHTADEINSQESWSDNLVGNPVFKDSETFRVDPEFSLAFKSASDGGNIGAR